jgi:hypothetical protein
MIGEVAEWFFSPAEPPLSAWRTILWWERRRIPFNIIVGLYGVACLALFFWAITTSGRLAAGEDAVEPIAIVMALLGVNAAYTLGWLVEVLLRLLGLVTSSGVSSAIMRLGLVLGLLLMTVPAAFWVGVRALQFLGALR